MATKDNEKQVDALDALAREAARAVAKWYVKHFVVDGAHSDFEIRFDVTTDIGFYWANPQNQNDQRDPVWDRFSYGDLDPERILDGENPDEDEECLYEFLYNQYSSDPEVLSRLSALL